MQKARRNGDAPGLAPEDSQVATIDFGRGDIANTSQRQEMPQVITPLVAIEGGLVGCFARIVADTGFGPLAPVLQCGESDSFRAAPYGIEADLPGCGQSADGFVEGKICSTPTRSP